MVNSYIFHFFMKILQIILICVNIPILITQSGERMCILPVGGRKSFGIFTIAIRISRIAMYPIGRVMRDGNREVNIGKRRDVVLPRPI